MGFLCHFFAWKVSVLLGLPGLLWQSVYSGACVFIPVYW